MSFGERLMHAWNAFRNNRDPTANTTLTQYSTAYRPDTHRLRYGNDKSIMAMILNRIAVDCVSQDIRHVRINENGQFADDVDSYLNQCLTVEANIDQTAREFFRDVVLSMFDEGVVCIVPTDTDINPETGAFDVKSMRTAQILEWYPEAVRVKVYDEKVCQRKELIIKKRACCIIENPFYSIMNEPNGILQRLIRKMALMDSIDEQAGAGKLDLIIQLPYSIKSKSREDQAERRRSSIEHQLKDSKYGIAYTDATERITQLNRPLENNLQKQIEYLTSTLYNQLGLTQEVFDGTADEQAMLNYRTRTVEPVLCAIVEELRRKFLTKTARTQGQTIMFFSTPFKLVTAEKLADIADKFTRNEIMSSNEFRAIVGLKPSDDPTADELRNKNLNREGNDPLLEGQYPPAEAVPQDEYQQY